MRVKLYFKCRHSGCGSIFKKSCNLRDHFRKHTGQRPFTCPKCRKTFTQSGNLGRHLKNVHGVPRESISFYKRQSKVQGTESDLKSIEQWKRKLKAMTLLAIQTWKDLSSWWLVPSLSKSTPTSQRVITKPAGSTQPRKPPNRRLLLNERLAGPNRVSKN